MSEKHLPYDGGDFDRIVFDGDGSVWVRERTANLKSCRACSFFDPCPCGGCRYGVCCCTGSWYLHEFVDGHRAACEEFVKGARL